MINRRDKLTKERQRRHKLTKIRNKREILNSHLAQNSTINGLSIRPDTVKLLEEFVFNQLKGTGKDFLNRIVVAQNIRPTINK